MIKDYMLHTLENILDDLKKMDQNRERRERWRAENAITAQSTFVVSGTPDTSARDENSYGDIRWLGDTPPPKGNGDE